MKAMAERSALEMPATVVSRVRAGFVAEVSVCWVWSSLRWKMTLP